MNPEHTIQDDSDIPTTEEREACYEYPEIIGDTEYPYYQMEDDVPYEYDGEYCTEVYDNENPF